MANNRSSRPLRVEESGVIQALGPSDLSLAASVGKYRFLGVLGHGGMADVYLAMADGPEGFRKLCVVKMLKEAMANDDDFRAMFVDEARLAARLTHPNIVQTYEVESVSGHLLLAMEYVEGATLMRVRRRMTEETFPIEAAVRVLCDVLDALAYAHEARDFDGESLDIVHRDVSPHNIIVGYSGNVKLVDFGIAKSTASLQATQAGVLKGKIGYMAPEQASFGEVDQRADLFSVGVILWEAIAGRRLIEGTSSHASLLRRVEGGEPRIEEIVPDVDPELAAIVGRALAGQAERYASAVDMQADLESWLSQRIEMPRRVWAANIAAAFEEDRSKLQGLAHVRSISASVPALDTELMRSAPPPAVTSMMPALAQSELPPHLHQQPLMPMTAPAPSRARPVLIVLGLLATAAVVGVIAYLASSATTRPAPAVAGPSSNSASAASIASTTPTQAPSSIPLAPAPSEPRSAAAPVVIPRGNPRGNPPSPPSPPARTARAGETPPEPPQRQNAQTAPAPTAPTAPTERGARPLDERDPYSP